ncbi:hypothetical protein ACS0TY_024119 [Phlomoides rotata]
MHRRSRRPHASSRRTHATVTGLMEDRCTTFANLKPSVQNWFVKALVVEKTPIRSLKWGRQQRLVLIDKESIYQVLSHPNLTPAQSNKILHNSVLKIIL